MTPLVATPVAQVGSLPALRLVGFGLVVLVAVALLVVAIRHDDLEDPVYEQEGDDPEVSTPGPSYGVGGTTDVTEVLEVDEEEEPTDRDDDEYDPFH